VGYLKSPNRCGTRFLAPYFDSDPDLVYRFQQFVAKGIELHQWVASRMGIKWWLGRAHIGPPASTVWRRHLAPPLRQLAADQHLEPAAPLGRERRDLPVEQRAGLCDCTQVDRTEVIALEKMQ
jgi:hypothetical protein